MPRKRFCCNIWKLWLAQRSMWEVYGELVVNRKTKLMIKGSNCNVRTKTDCQRGDESEVFICWPY